MKPISAKISKSLNTGAELICADNSGAKILKIISVKRYKGVKNRLPKAGVADIVVCTVKKGSEKIRHNVVHAVVIRQKKEYRRKSGIRVKFDSNAAILVDEKNGPKGKQIKGPVAREVVERFSKIGKIASIIV